MAKTIYPRAMRFRRALVPALLAAVSGASAPSRADLLEDADRLIERWGSKAGTSIERRATLFLEQGRATPVRLSDPAKAPAKPSPCVTVVLLAPRTSDIAFLTDGTAAASRPPPASLPLGHPTIARDETGVVRSQGGVATLSRCGKEQAQEPLEAERILVQSISPRTAVEVLVVRSQTAIDAPETILPERAVGPSAPRGDTGRALDPGPLSERLLRIEKRSREAGTERVVKIAMTASANGNGTFSVKLSEGCHTLDVLAAIPPKPARGTDIDAEARAAESGRLLDRDRGEAPDAHLDFCLGEAEEIEVAFVGAAGPVEITLVDARWPLPAGIPSEWGPAARGDIAAALRRRHMPDLPPEPILTVMGVQGETIVPFAVEPGECYLAVAAEIRGETKYLRLAVELGDRSPHDDINDRAEAVQAAFCATTEDRAVLRVGARGAQPWWLGLVWRVSR